MPYSARMQKNHLYSVFFAPRGNVRMVDLGMQIAQQYLSPFDRLIGLVGSAGSGKSMLIKGMFPGLELTNDDEGVNVRPLPLLNIDDTGFYTAHTYHIDVRFEMAFTQLHLIADAVDQALAKGKRVVVEHFDLLYPALKKNAHLLIGIGEEIIITRPTIFGPVPAELANIVFSSIEYRRKAHSAEDVCEFCLQTQEIGEHQMTHSDVRHGFILSFEDEPKIDFKALNVDMCKLIAADVPISYYDDSHILIGDSLHHCTGPRMHVTSTGQLGKVSLVPALLREPITENYLLVGVIGELTEDHTDMINSIKIM
ncbi:MAG: alanine-tRNA synthetase second additional domain-containing protein [Clostridia bacterium]